MIRNTVSFEEIKEKDVFSIMQTKEETGIEYVTASDVARFFGLNQNYVENVMYTTTSRGKFKGNSDIVFWSDKEVMVVCKSQLLLKRYLLSLFATVYEIDKESYKEEVAEKYSGELNIQTPYGLIDVLTEYGFVLVGTHAERFEILGKLCHMETIYPKKTGRFFCYEYYNATLSERQQTESVFKKYGFITEFIFQSYGDWDTSRNLLGYNMPEFLTT
jgi:hypothetical protein